MKEMNIGKKYSSQNQYYYKETITAGNGEAILIPCGDISSVSHSMYTASTGTGKTQFTNSTREDVGNNVAVWIDYTEGAIISPAVTAIRQVCDTGTTTLEVKCQ